MNRKVHKTIEIHQSQFADKVSDVPVELVVQVQHVQVVAETAETPQLLLVEQFPRVQVVEEAVEIQQLQVVKKIGEIPEWLNSVKGVVDSEDFPVYIPGETLQQNKILRVVKKTLVKSRLGMIAEIERDEGRELMLQGNDSVSVAKDVEYETNDVSEMCSSASGSTQQ